MKRIALLAALAVGIMVLPSAASANSDCSHATQVPGTPLYVNAGGSGLSGAALASVGACVDLGAGISPDGGATTFQGGAVEAGVCADCGAVLNSKPGIPGVYAVVDGDDENTAVSAQGGGYVGLSNFETTTPDPDCDGNDDGSGSNSGGCLTLRGPVVVALPVPLLACGNTSGKAWGSGSSRDGCSIP